MGMEKLLKKTMRKLKDRVPARDGEAQVGMAADNEAAVILIRDPDPATLHALKGLLEGLAQSPVPDGVARAATALMGHSLGMDGENERAEA